MTKKQKRNLRKITFSACLFALSIIFKKPFSVILLFASYLTVGLSVLSSAARKILSGQIFDEEFLMTLATVGAILMGELPEAVMVMLLYQLGELFQGLAIGKSRKSIKELMKLKPEFATVLRDGKEIRLSPEDVKKDESVIVLPGEKIPLDGIIEEGFSSIDTSSLTGESMPVDVSCGDAVISGTINLSGALKIRSSGTYAESTVAKILNLIEKSSAYKSKSEKFITKFSRKYTPCVFAAALITAFIPPLLFSQPITIWLKRALVFLVVSCPCALVISIPLSFFGGIGAASKKGILIKGASHLENLAKVSTFAFDKTGTLTQGGFSVTEIKAYETSEKELLEMAALAECFINHPISVSIVDAYGKQVDKSRVSDFTNIPGKGISATIDGKKVLAGNLLLMKENDISLPETISSGTAVYISADGKISGYIVLTDEIKADSKRTIEELKKLGIKRTAMLTGDNQVVADKVAKELGINETYSGLLPQDKVDRALSLKKDGEILSFAGDGINDAPVLSCVDVGIAMGALGSDAAIEAADVVIMNDSLFSIAEGVKIAKKTMRIVRQNIFFSLVIKFGVMLLSTVGYDNMYAAIFADVGVMIIAVLNAMQLLVQNKKK